MFSRLFEIRNTHLENFPIIVHNKRCYTNTENFCKAITLVSAENKWRKRLDDLKTKQKNVVCY